MCVGGLPNIVGYSITLFVCILHAWTAMRVFTAPAQLVEHGAYQRETPRLRDQEHSGQIVSHEKWKLGRGLFYWNSGVVPQSIRTQRPPLLVTMFIYRAHRNHRRHVRGALPRVI